jgi:transcriptional regulator with XRE-family HTH domain
MARGSRKVKGRRTLSEVQIDKHVGYRVRTRRTLLGLNQSQLGEACGITFQQLQKYESGANRISASRLYQISKILDVPVSDFYEDIPGELGQSAPPETPPTGDEAEPDTMHKRETLELVRAYYRIENADLRGRLRNTIRAIAGEKGRGRPPGVRS